MQRVERKHDKRELILDQLYREMYPYLPRYPPFPNTAIKDNQVKKKSFWVFLYLLQTVVVVG